VAPAVIRQERRAVPRSSALALGVIGVAVMRPGLMVSVVTISARGALVESPAPVRPGVRTELTLDAADGRRWPVGVEVLRCWVSALEPLRYQAAMRFEHPLPAG
jgi:hypothetical protein